MIEKPKCKVASCNNKAFVLYKGDWICGECLLKIEEFEKREKFKMLEELNNAN